MFRTAKIALRRTIVKPTKGLDRMIGDIFFKSQTNKPNDLFKPLTYIAIF